MSLAHGTKISPRRSRTPSIGRSGCSRRADPICRSRIRPACQALDIRGCANCGCNRGEPVRIFYAFDPRRTAILLIGGHKTGDDRFYARMIPLADRLYDIYLAEIRKEGLI